MAKRATHRHPVTKAVLAFVVVMAAPMSVLLSDCRFETRPTKVQRHVEWRADDDGGE